MTDLEISSLQTLHDITGGDKNFIGIVHIQSQDGKDFYFGYPSQQELDAGHIDFKTSSKGYASIMIEVPKTGLIALKSDQPMNVRVWTDVMSAPVPPSPTPSVPSTPVHQEKFNLSLLIWGVLVILAILALKRK